MIIPMIGTIRIAILLMKRERISDSWVGENIIGVWSGRGVSFDGHTAGGAGQAWKGKVRVYEGKPQDEDGLGSFELLSRL